MELSSRALAHVKSPEFSSCRTHAKLRLEGRKGEWAVVVAT